MSWLVIQRWLTWSAVLCYVSAPFNWRWTGPNATRALLSDLIGLIRAIHSARSAAAASVMDVSVCRNGRSVFIAAITRTATILSDAHLNPDLQRVFASSSREVICAFIADQSDCMIRVLHDPQRGLLFLISCAAMWKSLHVCLQCSLCPTQIGSLHIPHLFNDTVALCK